MFKPHPRSASRSSFAPLTIFVVFALLCAALVFTPVLASKSSPTATPHAQSFDNTRIPATSPSAPPTGLRADSSAKGGATLGPILGVSTLLSTISPPVFAGTTYTWNQTGSAAWTTAANWTPTRTTPATDDLLVFNNGATTTVTAVPTQTIGQLSVSGNTTVNLQSAGAVTLTISGGGTGLSVAAGSALNCNANFPISISVAAGTTGSISGSMTFSATSGSITHNLIAVSASGITFNSGAVFTQGTNNTGNVFGSGTSNSVVFASGSTFIQKAGSNPFQKTQPASVVVFQTGSLFSHQMSGAPAFSGRTYSNFELNIPGSVSVTGGNPVVMDNLTITAGTLNWGMTATPGHAIKGSISIASGGTLNFNPATAGTVNLNGGSAQTISGAGAFTTTAANGTNQTFNVNNANGISLQKDITISGGLTLTAGNITASSNTLTIASTGTVTRASGHIIGNLLKAYAAAGSKNFEVGTANGYSPVTFNATAGTFPANLTVKATQGPQPNLPDPTKALQRYWSLTATGVTADLTFSYLASDVPVTANENNFTIIKYNGVLSQPGGSVNSATHAATISSVSSFSDWTLVVAPPFPVPNCPTPLNTTQGTATSEGVSATDSDGTVTSASITSVAVTGITLNNFTAAGGPGGTATATLNVANTTAPGTYNVTIQYLNNDATPQSVTCTVVVNVATLNQQISPNCPTPLNTTEGTATSEGVSATDPDGRVTSASITSTPVTGITLDNFVAAPSNNTAATATLNVAATTAAGTYNVTIQYSNDDSPTAQTAPCTVVVTVQPPPVTGKVVISQVYGGGGNTGSTLKNDYIELINHSSTPISLNGWSVQVLLGTWQVTPLTNFTLQPGQYYLVQESQGAGGTDNLPTPDAVGTITVSSTSGKVALVNSTTALTGTCPSSSAIVDFVGYGTVDCFEGSAPAPILSNTIADLRLNSGCFDTNDNAHDFVTGGPTPHNSSSATNNCTGLSGVGSANPSTVLQGDSTTLTVYVAAGQNPASTGITVTANLTAIGGSASQAFSGAGGTFTFFATVPSNNAAGMKSLPVTITDAQSRSANTNIALSVLPLTPDHITISQVYGGGGNAGAPYTNDYVELYNPTASTITITGWTLQYGAATGTSWTNKQPLGGVIGPGNYYLVSLASGAVGAPLPVTPNISGGINMSATAGKIVLVRNSDSLSGGCPLGIDPDIVDFVGYGTTANCHEGNANTPAPSNTVALFRANNGGRDTDQNGSDFTTGTPNPRRTEPVVELGPWVAGTDPISDDFNIPHDASVTVNFSEPVNVDPGWYNINCVSTGLHNDATVAHTNDFKTYGITPNTNFQFGEQCTVSINKTAVHDQDNDDSNPDTDTLLANETWSFSVVAAGQAAPYPPSVHLTMGNPSNATASLGNPNNYLMEKPTYNLSYNRDKGTPNWVSWHLDPSWYGTLARVDTFRADPAVDPTWYRVQGFDYSGSGFDRGHMTPNADRDNQNRIPINQETYLMTNMIPQAPDNNQGPWANLEADLRTLTDAGNEVYIVSGPSGVGGVGSASASTVNTIANGHVTVPASTWKVVLVLSSASGDDVSRVTCSSRTIAVLLPNTQGIRTTPWQNFLTTVDAIEQLTGYDFYSNLPPAVQSCVEAGTNGTNPPGTANQSATTAEESPVTITLQALQANSNTLTFSIVSGPSSGSLGTVGASSCSAGTCTANVTYTPGANFSGPDSFTFKASDGTLNSTPATVSITVTQVNDNPSAVNDSKQTPEDSSLNFPATDLTSNDSPGPSEAGQTLTVDSVSSTANTHGSVLLSAGQVNYTADANYNGPASFDYHECDNGTTNGSSDPKCTTGTVNVTVTEVNDAPTAVSEALSNVAEDSGQRTISFATLTANDSKGPANESGQTLIVKTVGNAVGGTVSIASGNVLFTPTANYNGPASFDYTVEDNGTTNGAADPRTSGSATASFTITEVNDVPSAVNDTLPNVAENSGQRTITFATLTANDSKGPADESGQSLIVKTVGNAVGGTVSISGGNVLFTPAADYNGPASFDYTVEDNGTTNGVADPKTSGAATVTFNITDINEAPTAVNDSLGNMAEDAPQRTIPFSALTGNDSAGPANESGQTLIVKTVSNPVGITVSIVGNTVRFTPLPDYNGPASFQYIVEDNGTTNGLPDPKTSGPALAHFNITAVNDVPAAVNDSLTNSAEDSGDRTIPFATLTANDSKGPVNENGQTLIVKTVGNAVGGTVSIVGGNVLFTPTSNFNGLASFDYTVEDNGTTNGVADPRTSAAATVSFTITPVTDTPSVTNATTSANTQTTSGLVISRSPADGAEVTHFKITGITGGTLFKNNGTTVINNGDFITFAEGNAGLKFTPGITNGSFTVQASTSASDAGLGGGTVQASIIVNPLGGVFRFSAANYSVSESAGFKTIIVERSGDTSQGATVNYATSDDISVTEFTPCTPAGTGFASSRCDYTAALGTLQFAPGETSRTFNVLITLDNYVEGTETLNLTLSIPTGEAVLGVPSAAILSILDDASPPPANPIDTASNFVRALYHDILSREPDPAGLAFWTDNIEKCNDPARLPAGQTVAQCIDKQRESTAIAFFMSPEFQMTGGFVYRLYKGSLTGLPNYDGGSPGRFPTSLEFIHDISQVAEGIVVAGQISGATVEANRNRLATAFVQRPEFVAKYGGLNNTLYVQELFNTTGIAATAAEKQALVDGLTNGTETRASVLRKIVDGTVVTSEANVQFTTPYGQAFYNQEYRRVFVYMEYIGFLRRNPEAAGFNFWLGKLNFFNGDPFQAEMVRSFILSPEYRSRFGQP